MALKLALLNQRYHRNFLHYSQKPIARGVIYNNPIDMTRMDKPKITAAIMGKILEGKTSFYLPYLLNEINNDFMMRKNQLELSRENENIFKWIYGQKINYELNPLSYTFKYRDSELFVPKSMENAGFELPREVFLREFNTWMSRLKNNEPELYRERFSIDEKDNMNVIKYWKASIMLHLTADSIIDESHLDKI